MERLPEMLKIKAQVAHRYRAYFETKGIQFFVGRDLSMSTAWLNAIVADDHADRDAILQATNPLGVMTRPIWRLMSSLAMFRNCQTDGLENSKWLEDRIVNIPSSVPDGAMQRITV
jgi:dTDP-4-amino-4,6-dideoxygalactose transaminase